MSLSLDEIADEGRNVPLPQKDWGHLLAIFQIRSLVFCSQLYYNSRYKGVRG